MSITLFYKGNKPLSFNLTRNPMTNRRQSPKPEGKGLEDLDPQDPNYQADKQKILKHPQYSPSETVVLKPGLNKFENEEQAAYLYEMLGNPEVGGYIPLSDGSHIEIQNENVLIEVDEKGEEIKDNLFKKFRQPMVGKHIAR